MLDDDIIRHSALYHYQSEYSFIPIIKYKAKVKAEEKMRFTKENVYKVFSQYRKDSNFPFNDLQDEIKELDDTPEKVVVPKFVAEWIEWNKKTGASSQNMLRGYGHYYNNVNSYSEADGKKAMQWYVDNPYKFIRAYEDGYTIKKEPQYIVSIMDLGIDRIILIKNWLGYSFELESESDDHWEIHFTEQQIKEYDKRYWQFATPKNER